jgi:hypothetical protein
MSGHWNSTERSYSVETCEAVVGSCGLREGSATTCGVRMVEKGLLSAAKRDLGRLKHWQRRAATVRYPVFTSTQNVHHTNLGAPSA